MGEINGKKQRIQEHNHSKKTYREQQNDDRREKRNVRGCFWTTSVMTVRAGTRTVGMNFRVACELATLPIERSNDILESLCFVEKKFRNVGYVLKKF